MEAKKKREISFSSYKTTNLILKTPQIRAVTLSEYCRRGHSLSCIDGAAWRCLNPHRGNLVLRHIISLSLQRLILQQCLYGSLSSRPICSSLKHGSHLPKERAEPPGTFVLIQNWHVITPSTFCLLKQVTGHLNEGVGGGQQKQTPFLDERSHKISSPKVARWNIIAATFGNALLHPECNQVSQDHLFSLTICQSMFLIVFITIFSYPVAMTFLRLRPYKIMNEF